MAQIIVTHGIPDGSLSMLKGHIVHYPGFRKAFTPQEMLSLLPETDAVLACGALTQEMIQTGKKLKIISNYGAGYDRIDVAEATRLSVPVTNCPDKTALPTAEIAIGLMLSVTRRIGELDRKLRRGKPEDAFGMGASMGMSLQGKSLGIIGMGNIGAYVADFGRMIGMKIAYYNRRRLSSEQEKDAVFLPLDELLLKADVVSIHCPLTDETRNLLSAQRLTLLKPSSVLINTARGAIVDIEALICMLKEGRLAGAGLDVFANEPHVPEALLHMEQVVLTPHIGTNTKEARDDMAAAACERILLALEGKRPPNVINPEVYL